MSRNRNRKNYHILLTNDDGFESPGLLELREALGDFGKVSVVAPTIEKSACGHSLTLTRPLHFVEIEKDFYKLDDGTPSDCIFLALKKLFDGTARPDLVVSGINRGANMGEDITYSGTAAAAMEAVLHGIPSIALSQVYRNREHENGPDDFSLAIKAAKFLAGKILKEGMPLAERKFLNVNIPPVTSAECRGYMVTHAGHRVYENDAQVHFNPRGLEYFWIGLPSFDWRRRPHAEGRLSDFEAVRENYVSITPVQLDMTSYADIGRVEEWL